MIQNLIYARLKKTISLQASPPIDSIKNPTNRCIEIPEIKDIILSKGHESNFIIMIKQIVKQPPLQTYQRWLFYLLLFI